MYYNISRSQRFGAIDFPRCTKIPKNDLPKCIKIPRCIQHYQKISKKYLRVLKHISDVPGISEISRLSQMFQDLKDVIKISPCCVSVLSSLKRSLTSIVLSLMLTHTISKTSNLSRQYFKSSTIYNVLFSKI